MREADSVHMKIAIINTDHFHPIGATAGISQIEIEVDNLIGIVGMTTDEELARKETRMNVFSSQINIIQ